ncbi:hypothetical protein Zm00014a_044403 [Zea mays]|uniref:Replication protein A 70 kDa DNA-binding subunit B/D first OB fold domain-containing protein n=1 Tax=Zea mays TaxID=4577 RepID=A0A3L6G2Z6_MAIZE|nr:hypothetical protein Zm00014a_044403 [Zea mays]
MQPHRLLNNHMSSCLKRPTKIAHTMVAHQTSAHIVAHFSGFRNGSKACLLLRSAGLCTTFVAEEMGDILIPSLMVGDCSHSLCVRVSRLWEFLDPQDDSRLLHTDLVLLDEEGNSIHAQIYPPLCQQFSALLDEGGVYNLKYFLVRKANRFYKPVENSSMISFTKWTTVEVVLQIPPAFPVCTYNLTPINSSSRVWTTRNISLMCSVLSV